MDFDDTRDEAEFRKEVRQWLAANAEPKSGAFETWQSRYPGRDGYEGLERAKEFQAKKADAGFAALHWPVEWGGDRKSTRLNSSHSDRSRMPSSA